VTAPAPASAPRVLVVEDEEAMASGLEYAFRREGYEVGLARDGEAALRLARERPWDLVVLDVMLPKLSGYDVVKRLRDEGRELPVLLLTARGQEADKLRGFDAGADDYVTKPFSLAELLARVRARLKRRRAAFEAATGGPATDAPRAFAVGAATVDLAALEVRHEDGRRLPLTVREADMLRLLFRERGRAVSRTRFLDEVWGLDRFPTTRTVDAHVVKLRQKIERDPASPRFLVTVHGLGYRLEA